MSIISNTFTRHDAIGVREDLADVIYDISPTETPVLSSVAKGRMKQTLKEWQLDSLAAVDTTNAHIEGDDIASFPAVTPTVRVGNYAQISRKLLILSDTQEVVDSAGRASELAYQVARDGKELKRDMEAIIFENQGGDAGSTSAPRDLASLGAWLKSNTVFQTGGAPAGADPTYTSGVPGAARTDDGTPVALTETMFKDAIEAAWLSGANIDAMTAYAGAHNKGVISGFSGVVTRNYDISGTPRPTAVIAAIDVYVSDFGTVRVMPHRFMRARDVYLLDPEFLAVDKLRDFRLVKLAKTGDAEKRMLLVEWTLRVKNEAAHAAVFDLTSS